MRISKMRKKTLAAAMAFMMTLSSFAPNVAFAATEEEFPQEVTMENSIQLASPEEESSVEFVVEPEEENSSEETVLSAEAESESQDIAVEETETVEISEAESDEEEVVESSEPESEEKEAFIEQESSEVDSAIQKNEDGEQVNSLSSQDESDESLTTEPGEEAPEDNEEDGDWLQDAIRRMQEWENSFPDRGMINIALAADTISLSIYRDGDVWYRYQGGGDPHVGTGIWKDQTGTYVQCGTEGCPPPSGLGTGEYGNTQTFTASLITDENVRKVLYYGFGGPGQWSGFSSLSWTGDGAFANDRYGNYTYFDSTWKAVAYAATHMVLSHYNPNNSTKVYHEYLSISGADAFKNFISSASNAPDGFKVYRITGNSNTQDMFTWRYEPEGKITLTKSSDNVSVTSGNGQYSLAGAKYGIYKTKANADSNSGAVGTLTVKANGTSNEVTLPAGTYYIKETTAPTGYKKDATVYTVTVTSGKTTNQAVKDSPLLDPNLFSIRKESTGSVIKDKEAVFKVEYFASQSTSGNATRTWYVKTIDGVVSLHQSKYYIDNSTYNSDELYYIEGNKIAIPIGSIRISEVKNPDGYFKTNEVLTGKIAANSAQNAAVLTWDAATSRIKYNPDGTVVTIDNPKVPSIATTLLAANDSHYTKAEPQVTLTDTISLTDMGSYVGTTVKVSGALHLSGESSVLKLDGTEIKSEKDVKITSATQDVELTYTFDASELAGKTVVATASVASGSQTLTSEDVLTNEAQSVHFPQIGTTLLNKETDAKVVNPSGHITLVDTVSYTNLEPGKEYTLQGKLVNKATGEQVEGENGAFVTAETKFTPDTADGTVTIEFSFMAPDGLAGQSFVAFEEIPGYAAHADINDASQTVYFPEIRTTAKDSETGAQSAFVDNDITIIDTVAYKNLEAGKTYKLTAALVDKKTGLSLRDGNGFIEANKEFTAAEQNGSVDVEITFSGLNLLLLTGEEYDLNGNDVVVYENLYDTNDHELAKHQDANDEGQTIHFPDGHTTAYDAETEEHITSIEGTRIIVDEVYYENLLPETKYTVTGKLMVKADVPYALLDANQQPYVKTVEFTTPAAEAGKTTVSGMVPVQFEVKTEDLKGKTLVAFEVVRLNGKDVFIHEDIDDAEQTVYVPGGETAALGADTGIRLTNGDSEVTIVDTVFYENLLPEKEYTLEGILMNKKTNEPLQVNGQEVTSSVTFTTPASTERTVSGEVEMRFTFDGSALQGTTIVAFEELYRNGIEIFHHKDINDVAQTVYIPKGGTQALDSDTGANVALADEEMTFIDTVYYENLLPGYTYKVNGALMDKATGFPLVINGVPVVASAEFTPEEQEGKDAVSGSVDVIFHIDASELKGREIVAFETVTYGGVVVFVHQDITDEGQTVHFPNGRTTAYDAETGEDVSRAAENRKIVDVVNYENLLPETTYTVTGTLMVKADEPYVLKDGNGRDYTETVTFTTGPAEEGKTGVSGSVTVEFNNVNASELQGKDVVVFETIRYQGRDVFVHADINDEAETIHFPGGHTAVKDTETGVRMSNADDQITLIDTVYYENLPAGREYTVKGVLINKETGEPISGGSDEAYGYATFTTPDNGEPTVSGSVDVEFTFDGRNRAGYTIVVYEEMYRGESVVFQHHDYNDEAQTIHIPEGWTTLVDSETEDHISLGDEEITLIDTVHYGNLLPGKEYTVEGVLMDKETGEPLLVNGEEVRSSTTFMVEGEEDTSGSVNMVFKFDGSALRGKTLVAFETIYYEGKEVVVHADIEDEDQTVYIPNGRTTVVGDAAQAQNIFAGPDQTFTDTVYYENLLPEEEYTIIGTLMVGGEEPYQLLDAEGAPYVSAKTFTTGEAEEGMNTVSGMEEISFAVDASELAGKHIVVFERILYKEKDILVDADVENVAETLYIPDGRTTLRDSESGIQAALSDDEITLIDTVYYENLLPNMTYTYSAELMDKETGEPLVIGEEPVVSTGEFTTPDSEEPVVSGTFDVQFVFNGSELAGKTLVAFETVALNDAVVFEHKDINDTEQTVYIPNGGTTLVDSDTEDHIANADEEVVLVDTVAYENLKTGYTYRVSGVLMDKETGEPLLVNGLPVVGSSVLAIEEDEENETASGTIEVVFTFDGSALKGKTVVAFETISYEDVNVFIHADIEDEAQTVYFPNGGTEAKDSKTGTHTSMAEKEVRIVDTVSYENLLPGKEYTVEGILMDKETGEPLMVDNKEVRAEAKFVTPEISENVPEEEQKEEPEKEEKAESLKTVSGSVEVVFEFDGSALKGKTVVAFETVKMDDKEVLVHADIEDKAQTIYFPEIGTQARDKADNDQEVAANKDVVVVDKVSYKNLNPEMEYKVKGVLMDKHTGKALTIGGKEVSAEMTFKPEKADGEVELEFKFNTTGLANQKFVVFEEVYEIVEKEEVLVGEHKDINDEKQTIQVGDNPKTGDTTNVAPYLFTILVAGAFVLFAAKLRRKADEQ